MRSALLLLVTGGLLLYSIYGNQPHHKNHTKHMGNSVTAISAEDGHKALG